MFMSGCLCFGGGVLLATVFLHLLPETRDSFHKAATEGFIPDMAYPMTELVVCLGFFFVYVVEEVVHSCLGRGAGDGGHSHGHGHSHLGPLQADSAPSPARPRVKETAIDGDDATLEKFLPEEEEGAAVAVTAAAAEGKVATLRAVMVVVALSLHSIMEGLALGLVHSNKEVWMLFGALSAHKLIIAFCMAMELLSTDVSRVAFFVSLTIFSVASPLGGLAGTLLVSLTTQTTAAGLLVPTVLHGLSAGTLLYVTFCEILERERGDPNNPTVKMLGLVGGFLLMAGLQVLDIMYAPQEDAGLPSDPCSVLASPLPAYSPEPVPYHPGQNY
ncbi:Zinc transporter ZIP1 [Portunus trituberculatus]|uniref:Zinc transporter ZIP1 n=3 Tax=Portunus trituberculatus TaxID=210409 RepID=A0A5B7IIS9_PORTR|nr:Zinc transporter ZIP1 [Portunus trituberculatus]